MVPRTACLQSASEPASDTGSAGGYASRMRPRLALLVLVAASAAWPCASCGADRGPAPPPVAAPAPEPRVLLEDAAPPHVKVAANASCEACHADIWAEWRGSQHAGSWDDPVFLAAYAIEPLAFCRSCHAPEAPLEDTASPARHLGVGCITCHAPAGTTAGRAHVSFEPRGADAEGCAGCHQFEFPEPQEAAMQSTVEEHAASPERDQTCASCHMPRRSGERPHLDHRFAVQGDEALLRSAVRAEARRDHARVIEVSVRAHGAGHAVPTGDMFRRLEVHATAGEGPDAIGASPVVLSRELVFVMTEHGPRRKQVDDRRLPASGEPREARLVFPRPVGGLPIRWEVVYHRMGPREAALFGVDRDGEAVIVAQGELPAGTER
jgi:hypothetical protein